MSHHFDTPTAQKDPRINVCDLYLFQGRPGTTVMAMTVNPDAGLSAPDTFHDEGLYAFRFDLNRDGREELAFKVRFGAVDHADGDEHRHRQTFEIRRATGRAAVRGWEGEPVAKGYTGEVTRTGAGAMAYAGLAPDLFAGDAAALGRFRSALYSDGRYDPGAFENRKNFFARRNVTAIVIEVPSRLIGRGPVRGWATASLYGHAPEVQVSRWGLPLITHVFMPDAEMKEQFNRAVPTDDQSRFITQVGAVAEKLTSLTGSTPNPADYARQLTARLFPIMLPYELDTPAAFDFAGFNGRALTDDVMDVILTLATNTALGDGVIPDKDRTRAEFPYFGEPYSERRAGRRRAGSPCREERVREVLVSKRAAVMTGSLLLAAVAGVAAFGATDDGPVIARARFETDGKVDLPVGYRQWWHVGTRYKPDGISILDGLPLRTPELMNAYAEPGAMAVFQKTGKWPDGTQIVKEVSAIQVGKDCDETTRLCKKDIGSGIFEAGFMGLGMMVKDARRFPDAPGHWGYFSFGHKPPPYDSTSSLRPAAQCASCHMTLAAPTDYVIARAHIGLDRKTGN